MSGTPTSRRSSPRGKRGVFWDLLGSGSFIPLLLLAAWYGYARPALGLEIPTKYIGPMLGVVMFGIGLTLRLSDFAPVFSHPKAVLVGEIAQFFVMPVAAWVLVKAFSLPPALAIGVILVGACPGGTASNVITYIARGDVALSVGMTTISTLLAPVVTPALVWLFASAEIDVDAKAMFVNIAEVVLLPIFAGFLLNAFAPRLCACVRKALPLLSMLAIVLIVLCVVSHNAAALRETGALVVLVVVLHNLFGLGLGWAIARAVGLTAPQCRAISVEVGMQNSGLASALAAAHFAAMPLAAVPGALFSVWHNVSGMLLAVLFRVW